MPATTTKNGRVKGEGRVISVNAKYGFLAAQGINSKVFIIPSSLKMDAPFPALTDELHIDDLVTFEANEQAERNGAKYLAVDGSVKLKQRGKDVMVEGEGKIVRLDLVRGCFGFIDSTKVGSVFFNIAAVRPPTSDVGRVLKMGQKVKFRALPNSEQPNCKWRASLVCAFSKANEYLTISTNGSTNNNSNGLISSTSTTTNNGATSSFSPANLHNSSLNNGQRATKTKSKNSDSNRQRSKKSTINNHTVNVNSNNVIINNRSGSVDTHQKNLSSSKSRNYRLSSENLKTTTPPPETPPPPVVVSTGGGDFTSKIGGDSTSTDKMGGAFTIEKIGGDFTIEKVGGALREMALSSSSDVRDSSPKDFSTIVKQSLESATMNDRWPIFDKIDRDCPLNPAKMWDSYLEQQQKALSNQNFYNPFGESSNFTQIRPTPASDFDDDRRRFFIYSNPYFLDSQVRDEEAGLRNFPARFDWSPTHDNNATVNGNDEKCDYFRD